MIYLTPLGRFLPVYTFLMSTYTRSELESSGQCHQKSIRPLPLSSMPRVEPGLILIIGVASCAVSIREIHLMMNSRNIQPAKILRCTVSQQNSITLYFLSVLSLIIRSVVFELSTALVVMMYHFRS